MGIGAGAEITGAGALAADAEGVAGRAGELTAGIVASVGFCRHPSVIGFVWEFSAAGAVGPIRDFIL